MKKYENVVRFASVGLCELFTLITVGELISAGAAGNRLLMACFTMILVLMPLVMERLLRYRLSLPVYIFTVLYAIGPMLGHCYNWYYTVPGWDKLLHTSGGVVFALLGLCLFDLMNKGETSVLLRALFALCFSVALSVIWEFIEYAADLLLHTDMQQDTLVHVINSYLLGDRVGYTGSIGDISSVVVDGVQIGLEGYIDIGLHDTMQDMLVETLGALVVSVIHLCDGGKHRVVTPAALRKTPASP